MRPSLLKLFVALPLAIAASVPSHAASPPAASPSSAQTIMDAMTKANAAEVGVKVTVVTGA